MNANMLSPLTLNSPYTKGMQNLAQMHLKQAEMGEVPVTMEGGSLSAETKAKLWAKSKEFEAYFVQQFMDLTAPDLSDEPLMGGGFGEKAFTQKVNEEMAKNVVARGGFGVAKQVYTELLQMQEHKGQSALNALKTKDAYGATETEIEGGI